jgi:integrase
VGRYPKRAFQLGTSWLGQRTGSAAWYRCWREGNGTQRVSLGTADFEEAKQRLTDWFILQSQPQQESARITIAEVIARYWNERGRFTSHPPTVNTHCNYWLNHFGEKSVEDALAYAEQERFKTSLLDGGLSAQTVNHVISTGRAALRMAWKKGELKSVPPVTMLPVGDQEPMGRPVSLEETSRLLRELRDHVWLLNIILIGTLARPSAILQLDWSQVDFDTGLIFLNRPGRAQTKKRRPVVKMPPFLHAVLWARRGQGAGHHVRGQAREVSPDSLSASP